MKTKPVENISVDDDIITLTPTEATQLLVGTYKSGEFRRAHLFRGSPGIGKTTMVQDAARILGIDYIEINPTMPAEEVGGLPDIVRQEGVAAMMDYAVPTWFPRDPKWKGILCLDDGLQGDRLMQQTMANLIQARNLRGIPLPDGAFVVVTGNRMKDKAGVTKTLSHFGDRMCWFNIEADPKAWIADFAIPNNVDERIIGYIMMDNAKLNAFDPDKEKSPTPRTWAAVSSHLAYVKTLDANKMPKGMREKFALAKLAGEINLGEATKFWAFCEMFGRLPDVDTLLADPVNAKADFDLDVQYALVVAIANRLNPDNFENALTYVDRIGPDLTTLVAKLGAKGKKELTHSPAFTKWLMKNQDVIYGA